MPSSAPTSSDLTTTGKLKVFLSYSRKDGAFAQELLAALELLGFDAYLDKEDIAPGEPWENRLGNLIRLADTVVFIISPHSLVSKHCAWEVEETARAAKRLVPVMLSQVLNADVPERLRKLNYVFFTEGTTFTKGLGDLASALRADAGWIREHSRYGELANRWIERAKPEALLLRGSDLDDARRWMAERPTEAPEISANQLAFIDASGKAAEAEVAAKARLRWRVQAGLAVASLALAGLSAFSGLQWRNAEQAKSSLAETNRRLERRLALRVAPLGGTPYDVPAGWFQVATSNAGAVAFVEKTAEPGMVRASGAIVDARQLDPRWPEGPVFVTATYVVSQPEPDGSETGAMDVGDVTLVFFGPRNERRTTRLAKVLWQSPSLGVSISRIEGPLPDGATMIARVKEMPTGFDGLKPLSKSDFASMFNDKGQLTIAAEPRPIVFVGNMRGRQEVTLAVSHLIGTIDAPDAASGRVTRDIEVVAAPRELHADLVYTLSTLPGSGGSPIFDAETGDLIGIHLIGCGHVASEGRPCAGGGTSVPRILAAVRDSEPPR